MIPRILTRTVSGNEAEEGGETLKARTVVKNCHRHVPPVDRTGCYFVIVVEASTILSRSVASVKVMDTAT